MSIIISSFIIRIIIAFYNYYYGPISGADADAMVFHEEAINYSNYISNALLGIEESYNYRIGWVYSNFLGFFYFFFENHQLLYASIFSCIAWLLSCFVLIQILKTFEIDKLKINFILFSYCWLFPTSIIYNSVTLREPYILLLYNFLALIFINISVKGINTSRIFLLVSSLILFLLLHRANVIFVIIFTCLILSTYFFKRLIKNKNLLSTIFVTFIFVSLSTELIGLQINRNIFERIVEYRLGHFHYAQLVRAYYTSMAELKGLEYSYFKHIYFYFINFFNYIAQPMPWKMTSIKDLLLAFENLFRIGLYTIIFMKLFKTKKKQSDNRLLFNYLFISVLLMEFIYAQVTVNWGTASRHHLIINGLLLILAFKNQKKIN